MKNFIRIAGLGLALCVATLGAAAQVSAHAGYESSTPGDGETVASSPGNVHIVFKEEIQRIPNSYGIVVHDADGGTVSTGGATVGSDDKSLSVALKPDLPDGAYHVMWNNTSADDGDPDDGEFTFYVGSMPMPAPTRAPSMEATPHTHDAAPTDKDMGMPENAAPPTTGLISTAMTTLNGSGVSGRADIFPVDGGSRTRIDVYLTGMAPGSSHVGHVHMSPTCFEGVHVADLNTVTANGDGIGASSTTIAVPFSTAASGTQNILFHLGDATNPGKPAACGLIPAQAAGAGTVSKSITPPNTGGGAAASGGFGWLIAAIAVAGGAAVAGGLGLQAKRR